MLFLSLSFARVWPFRHVMSLSHPHMHPHLHSHMHPKLRQFNWSRSPNRLILWLNHLLIDFFDPNLKPDFNSSWQNRLKHVRIILKSSKSINFIFINKLMSLTEESVHLNIKNLTALIVYIYIYIAHSSISMYWKYEMWLIIINLTWTLQGCQH